MSQQNNVTCGVYTVNDIQTMLGLGKNKAYALCTSGNFIYKRVGRNILIPKSSFQTWLNSEDQ